MKRPAFQFYPADWRANINLRRCSAASRGVWMDVICALHDSDEYGVIRYPLKELCGAIGGSMAALKELVEKGVLKGSDTALADPYVYTPRSGRQDGEPVTLIAAQAGPIWYSSRMVRDEYVRIHRGEASRFGADKGDAPKPSPKPPLGDGSTSSSPSSSSKENSVAIATGASPPEEIVFGYGVPLLTSAGTSEKHARSFLGKLIKEHTAPAVVNVLRDCIRAKPLSPLEWMAAALPPKGKSLNRQEAIEDRNRAVGDAWLSQQGAA